MKKCFLKVSLSMFGIYPHWSSTNLNSCITDLISRGYINNFFSIFQSRTRPLINDKVISIIPPQPTTTRLDNQKGYSAFTQLNHLLISILFYALFHICMTLVAAKSQSITLYTLFVEEFKLYSQQYRK